MTHRMTPIDHFLEVEFYTVSHVFWCAEYDNDNHSGRGERLDMLSGLLV